MFKYLTDVFLFNKIVIRIHFSPWNSIKLLFIWMGKIVNHQTFLFFSEMILGRGVGVIWRKEGEKGKVLHNSSVKKLINNVSRKLMVAYTSAGERFKKEPTSSFSCHVFPINLFNAGKHKQAPICSVLSNSPVLCRKEEKKSNRVWHYLRMLYFVMFPGS